MQNETLVAGVGMTPFKKPGDNLPYPEMAARSVRQALQDAGVGYEAVQEVYAGYVYGDSTSGQRAVYEVGMTGVPIVNVNNNCASGSSALYLARKAIASGAADCVLAVGFEQMSPGALQSHWTDRPDPLGHFSDAIAKSFDRPDLPMVIRYFAAAGKAHMERYGTSLEAFARIRAKASRHAARNPLALFRREVTTEEVLAAAVLVPGVMTRPMACPPTCGAAATLLVSRSFAKKHGLDPAVRILAQTLVTDRPDTFEGADPIAVVGSGVSREAARQVYEAAGIGPKDVDVCELHDCFTQNELLSYEALGFCPEGEAEGFVRSDQNTYGGQVVVNPSGGLLSKGHPLGATGLAQCFELTHQLRGTAEARQVESARIAMQHNAGLGGATVVTLFGRAN
ncbi:lipid-transfer protein [Hydrogenophaga electricum]|uniref:propanoyl-CoA C-acyltransferase n=1 Tax=Hydrogenophaga electricum TaxID=1230953 RepID=A0ABQ6BY47_9BURK|nr:lipid-transfer protein [Hydrogenophaga electricum]GLS13113.1 lipid-transfer protein [Hydrogenophaga electricum]